MPDPIERSPFDGTATLLMGAPGTGKTYSLVTLVEAGLKLAILFTEPRGPESLMQALEDKGLPVDNVHWKYISPASPAWEDMIVSAQTINRLSYQELSASKGGINKSEYDQFIKLLGAHAEFICDRTGENLGRVDDLDNTWAVVTDSLSGLNIMAKDLVIGSKPVCAQGEWGVAMDNEERFLLKLCSDIQCFYILTAHTVRQVDADEGGLKKVPSALGRKLSPSLPRFFSDVVYTYREGGKFFWSVDEDDINTKYRNLMPSSKLPPSFVPIVEAWNRKKAIAEKEEKKK